MTRGEVTGHAFDIAPCHEVAALFCVQIRLTGEAGTLYERYQVAVKRIGQREPAINRTRKTVSLAIGIRALLRTLASSWSADRRKP